MKSNSVINTLRLTSKRRSHPAVFLVSISLLLLIYYSFTIVADWKFSPDVQVLQSVLDIYPFQEFNEALLDNSVVVWVIYKLRGDSSAYSYLYSFYWMAFITKWIILYRIYGFLVAVSITILFFFSFDLNQARLSISLSLVLLSYVCWGRSRFFSLLFLMLGFVSHVPFAVSLVGFYFLRLVPIKFAVIAISLLVSLTYSLLSLIEDSPAGRFIGYLEPMDGAEMTKFFSVTIMLLIVYRKYLSREHLMGAIGLILVSILSGVFGLINISGRSSELAAINILLIGNLPGITGFCESKSMRQRRLLFVLFISLLFFLYRFTQWVIMGNVPPPANL